MKIKILKRKQKLNEEFYFHQGFDPEERPPKNPLSFVLINRIARKLPGTKNINLNKLKRLKASGAEGVVVSLDDKRVIKIFHNISNAAKNLHLVSKNIPETAQVYSMGKIILDDPVVYYKFGSVHNAKTLANPTKELYYIVMQRVSPDSHIWNYVENVWNKLNMVFQADSKSFIKMYSTGDPFIQHRIEKIYETIMSDPEVFNVPKGLVNAYKRGNVDTFEKLMNDQRNLARLNSPLTIYKKKTRTARKQKGLQGPAAQMFLLYDVAGRPVGLKELVLNKLGILENVPFVDEIYEKFLQSPEMARKAKKSHPLKKNKSATLADDLEEIVELIKKIRIDRGLAWNDIHGEQFGRNFKGDLIGLDLGIKGSPEEIRKADEKFTAANIIRVNTKQIYMPLFDKTHPSISLKESKKKVYKTLNVFDFDKTLFWTVNKDEGKRKWEEVNGKPYPHKGWFGKAESLDIKLNQKINQTMKKIYNTLRSDPDGLCVLNSNRYIGLEKPIKAFLKHHGFRMDAVLLKTGQENKGTNLQEFWNDYPEITVINCFDDKEASLNHYKRLRDRYSLYRKDLTFNIYKVTEKEITKV